MGYRGRFAPSPTGGLHMGNLLVAFCAWARAYRKGGVCFLRMEDIDRPREVDGAAQEIMDDLEYVGLNFVEGVKAQGDHGPYVQSQCDTFYQAAIEHLQKTGRLFACRCSRKDIQRLASAPHPGEEGPAYPGTCREKNLDLNHDANPVAWRFHVSSDVVRFVDVLCGTHAHDVESETGDFVVRRKDGLWAYHLAVVVDDMRQGVTEVVRGRDLLGSTARQIQLYHALGASPPDFAHVPLWVDSEGQRMSKRRGEDAHTIRRFRERGVDGHRLLGALGEALGIAQKGEHISAPNLADRLEDSVLKVKNVTLDLKSI